jgi:hypothetical protein
MGVSVVAAHAGLIVVPTDTHHGWKSHAASKGMSREVQQTVFNFRVGRVKEERYHHKCRGEGQRQNIELLLSFLMSGLSCKPTQNQTRLINIRYWVYSKQKHSKRTSHGRKQIVNERKQIDVDRLKHERGGRGGSKTPCTARNPEVRRVNIINSAFTSNM